MSTERSFVVAVTFVWVVSAGVACQFSSAGLPFECQLDTDCPAGMVCSPATEGEPRHCVPNDCEPGTQWLLCG